MKELLETKGTVKNRIKKKNIYLDLIEEEKRISDVYVVTILRKKRVEKSLKLL